MAKRTRAIGVALCFPLNANRFWFGPFTGKHTMTDDAKQTAWREYCRKVEAIGVDPYAPELPNDDPRHKQLVAIVAEYEGSTSHKLALPPNWEGHEPIQPVDPLTGLAEWLTFQWSMVKGWELAGEQAKPMAMEDASRAIRNRLPGAGVAWRNKGDAAHFFYCLRFVR